MLNFSKGMKIAKIITNKKNDNNFIYFYDETQNCCKDCSSKCSIKNENLCCDNCSNILIHRGQKGIDEEDAFEMLELPANEKLQLMPSNMPYSHRSLLYITGPAGVGKSWFISNWLVQFKNMFKKNKIYLISRKKEDPVLDNLIYKRLDPEDFLEANFVAEDFKNEKGYVNCLIFDDTDSLSSDKKNNIKGAVYALMDDIIEIGRSLGIYCIVSSHIPANAKESKRILNGATDFVIFPRAFNRNLNYMLSEHLGLNKDNIEIIKNTKSRWACISRQTHPNTLITENLIKSIKY